LNTLFKKYFLLIFLCPFCGSLSAQQNAEQEANLKAAFIYNFTKYIDWGSYEHGNDFIIAVAGESPITQSLQEIARTSRVDDKIMIIKKVARPSDIDDCNILFITKECRYPLDFLLKKAGPGVLTISEEDGFAERGTAFNFVILNDRLKFEANLKAISSAGLKAGAQLLKLAIIVD